MNRLVKVLVLLATCVSCATLVDSGVSHGVQQQLKQVLQKKLHSLPAANLGDVDANAYVDQVLADMHDEILAEHLDPYEVFDVTVLGVNFRGYLGGFSTIHRTGDAAVSQTDTDLFIDVTLAIYYFEGDFNWTYSFMFIDYNGDADAICDYVDLYLSLQGPVVPGSSEVYLQVQALNTVDIGQISVEVHGFGIFDELIDIISQAVINLVSGLIPIIMDDIVLVIINEVIADYPFPLPEPATTVAVPVL